MRRCVRRIDWLWGLIRQAGSQLEGVECDSIGQCVASDVLNLEEGVLEEEQAWVGWEGEVRRRGVNLL